MKQTHQKRLNIQTDSRGTLDRGDGLRLAPFVIDHALAPLYGDSPILTPVAQTRFARDILPPIALFNTRLTNSRSFHADFSKIAAISRINGLLVHKSGASKGHHLGISNIKSHKHLDNLLTDGGVRSGTPTQLMSLLCALPGEQAEWEDIPDPLGMSCGRFDANTQSENALSQGIAALTALLGSAIAGPGRRFVINGDAEQLNGGYGILAHTRNPAENPFHFYPDDESTPAGPEEFRPEDVAVIGKTDIVFERTDGSGIVAFIEAKIYHQRSLEEYHSHNNSICAQIFASWIGSGAEFGLLLGNKRFKASWRRTVNGRTHLFTYPRDNSMADLSIDTDRLLLTQIMFHVVRCSIRIESDCRVGTCPQNTKGC